MKVKKPLCHHHLNPWFWGGILNPVRYYNKNILINSNKLWIKQWYKENMFCLLNMIKIQTAETVSRTYAISALGSKFVSFSFFIHNYILLVSKPTSRKFHWWWPLFLSDCNLTVFITALLEEFLFFLLNHQYLWPIMHTHTFVLPSKIFNRFLKCQTTIFLI